MNWLKNLFSTKSNAFSFFGNELKGNYSTENNLALEGYSLNSSANASINKIIKAIIQMRLFVTDKGDEENKPIENKLSILLNNPDANQGQAQWLEEYFGYYLTFGNSFILKFSNEMGLNIGQTKFLKVLSQRQIRIITKETMVGKVLDRYEFQNKKTSQIKTEDILHGKTFNPLNQVIGLSPLLACGLSIDMDNEIKRWNVKLLQNGVNPAGIYTTDGELTPTQFRRMQAQVAENSGPENAGKEKIMEGGLKYQQTGITPKDADFLKGQMLSKREIASVFNIAPQLIGDTASQTFANYEQAILSLHNDTAFPLLEALVDQLNNWLTPAFGDNLVIRIDDSGVEALTEQKQKRWAAIDASNELKTNEKRNKKGFDDLEDEEEGEAIVVNGSATLSTIVLNPQPLRPTNPTDDGKSEKSIKRISKKEYFKIQHKAMGEAEDDAIIVSHKIINRYFDNQFKEIVKNIKDMTDPNSIMLGVEAVIQQTTDDLQEVYNEIYKDVSFDFSLKARLEGKANAYGIIEKKVDIQTSFGILNAFKDEFGSFVDSYFVQIKLNNILAGVNSTSINMVQDTVASGIKGGASIFDITKDIKTLYGNDMTTWRAERIARTETLRGMSYAQQESQLKVSPLSKKVWIDAGDSRVRPTSAKGKFNHRNADLANGKIALKEAFRVSGQSLMFPRDTSIDATAGNVINCRCTVGYIDEEFESFFED